MKIALCCRAYSSHNRVGGMIHVSTDRAEALAKAGHEVHVLTTNHHDHSTNSVLEINGVKVHVLPGTPLEYSTDYSEACTDYCRRLQPHIIHLDSWDRHRPWWHERPGNPKVIAVSNHGEGIGSQHTDWLLQLHSIGTPTTVENIFDTSVWLDERYHLSEADVVIATCRFDKWMLGTLVGLGSSVKLVYNPISSIFFDMPRVSLPSKKRGLCLAVWGADQRGVHLATEACKELSIDLTLESGLPRQELVRLYDESTVFLLPGYKCNGYDITVAEAAARGRPIITSDNGVSTMEAIDRPWLKLVPVGDVKALVEALSLPMPTVPEDAAAEHHPNKHVENWLTALGV